MICEVPDCSKNITQGNLVYQAVIAPKKITLFITVCDDCIKRFNAQDKVRGTVRIVEAPLATVGENI